MVYMCCRRYVGGTRFSNVVCVRFGSAIRPPFSHSSPVRPSKRGSTIRLGHQPTAQPFARYASGHPKLTTVLSPGRSSYHPQPITSGSSIHPTGSALRPRLNNLSPARPFDLAQQYPPPARPSGLTRLRLGHPTTAQPARPTEHGPTTFQPFASGSANQTPTAQPILSGAVIVRPSPTIPKLFGFRK